jgi:hypothetical protein
VVRSWSFLLGLLAIVAPSMVWAGSLDDYYLARLAPKAKSIQLLTGVVGQAETVATQADRCLTPVYRSLKRDWKELEPDTRKVLAKQLSVPALAGAATYLTPGVSGQPGHFTIHFATTGNDAPDLTDADGNGVPEWVETVGAAFEKVYDAEVTAMGYRAPPVARYAVYLVDLTGSKAYGFTQDFYDGTSGPPASVTSVASYIEIDKAFTAGIFVNAQGGPFTKEQSLAITAAHEFHHAIQFGYNYYFELWYAEATATWMEDEVEDSVNQSYSYLSSYLSGTGTLSLNAGKDGRTEYGRWIFNRYLAQAPRSTTLIKDIWSRLGALPATADGSDIPMLPVVAASIAAGGSALADEFFGFAKSLYLRNWTSHVGDISRIPAVSPAVTYSVYPVSASVAAGSVVTPPHYTFAYYKFRPSATAPTDLTLTLSAVPSGLAVIAFKKGIDGSIDSYPLDHAAGTITIPSFNSSQTVEVQLLISNNGSSDGASVSFSSDGSVAATPAPASGSGKSGCFIATAAYGSYLHPKVALLRAFRDGYLLTNPPGRLFVAFYYRVSPPLADLIARHESLRGATRLLLAPVILAVEHGRVALVLLFLGILLPIVRRGRIVRAARRGVIA